MTFEQMLAWQMTFVQRTNCQLTFWQMTFEQMLARQMTFVQRTNWQMTLRKGQNGN